MHDGLPDRALSLREPWIWAIVSAGKDIENRTWPTKFRGAILLHASRRFDWDGYFWLRHLGVRPPELFPGEDPGGASSPYRLGAYRGVVTITGCLPLAEVLRQEEHSRWALGPYCFSLTTPQPLPEPIPGRGRLGIYRWRNEGSGG